MGEALGKCVSRIAKPEFAPHSVLWGAYQHSVPVTVHVAMGTDTPHTHPQADGRAIGATTHRDFRLLCSLVRGLDQGGVYLNLGSAVVLPEVFLKAVSVVRNLATSAGRIHHREFRFSAALPAQGERGGAAARPLGRQGVRHHRAS